VYVCVFVMRDKKYHSIVLNISLKGLRVKCVEERGRMRQWNLGWGYTKKNSPAFEAQSHSCNIHESDKTHNQKTLLMSVGLFALMMINREINRRISVEVIVNNLKMNVFLIFVIMVVCQ